MVQPLPCHAHVERFVPFEARLRVGQRAGQGVCASLKEHGLTESRTRPISVTSEGPDKKKQKKEEDKENKKEEERKKPSRLSYAARGSQSDVALHAYLFSSLYRVATAHALEKQAKCGRKINFSVLGRTPNHQSRLQECNDRNMIKIELRNERMREEEDRLRIPVQEAEDLKAKEIEKEQKEKDEEQKKQKEESKAARKQEKIRRKEEEKKAKETKKAEKKKEKKAN